MIYHEGTKQRQGLRIADAVRRTLLGVLVFQFPFSAAVMVASTHPPSELFGVFREISPTSPANAAFGSSETAHRSDVINESLGTK